MCQDGSKRYGWSDFVVSYIGIMVVIKLLKQHNGPSNAWSSLLKAIIVKRRSIAIHA